MRNTERPSRQLTSMCTCDDFGCDDVKTEILAFGGEAGFVDEELLDRTVERDARASGALSISRCFCRIRGQDASASLHVPFAPIGHPRSVGVVGEQVAWHA